MAGGEFIGYNEKVVKIAQRVPIFKGLDPNNFKVLLDLAKLIRYKVDESIIRENDYDATIFFLLEGTVTIVKKDSEVAVLNNIGDFFGEMAIIEGLPRSADVVAKTDCTVMTLDASVMQRLDIEGMDKVSKQFFQKFSEKLSERLRDVLQENERLKERIKELERRY